jgi:predicted nucleic acid-binding Zn ribbon protein
MEMMLGSPILAQVIGPNEDMAQPVVDRSITLCEECALPVMKLLESCPE